ncbi:hypothetical protein ACFPK1_22540 [Actinomycetospora rhizophila]|uniref:Uncharacterized protein n=1 Tax=Actinomycetospora rhizophila TaxID=1416876 RepID=A0ABV9ZK66_9PSEU
MPQDRRVPRGRDAVVDRDTATTAEDDLRLLVFTPAPGSDARSRLDLLAAVGTQSMEVSRPPA